MGSKGHTIYYPKNKLIYSILGIMFHLLGKNFFLPRRYNSVTRATGSQWVIEHKIDRRDGFSGVGSLIKPQKTYKIYILF